MDIKIGRLRKGKPLEREEILAEADNVLLKELVNIIMNCKRGDYSLDEQIELNAFNKAFGRSIKMLKSIDTPFHDKVDLLRKVGSFFIHKILKPRQHKRRRKDCPVPGCNSLGLLQLHNHLSQVHDYSISDRKYWLSVARLHTGVLKGKGDFKPPPDRENSDTDESENDSDVGDIGYDIFHGKE